MQLDVADNLTGIYHRVISLPSEKREKAQTVYPFRMFTDVLNGDILRIYMYIALILLNTQTFILYSLELLSKRI